MKSILALTAAFAMACTDSGVGEFDIDLTAYYDDIEAHCTGDFEGRISDDECTYSASCVPCSVEGQTYRLVVEAASKTHCSGSEDRPDVDCTHAQSATKTLLGTLTIGDEQYSVTGSAFVQKNHYQDKPVLICSVAPDTDAFTDQYFRINDVEELLLPSDSRPEFFTWGRKLSEETAAETRWERCRLAVDNPK